MRMLCPTCQCRTKKTTCLSYDDEYIMGLYGDEDRVIIGCDALVEKETPSHMSRLEKLEYFVNIWFILQ